MSQPSPSRPPSKAEHNIDLLRVYANDHHAAAGGGIELVSRMIAVHRGSSYEQPLAELLDQLREEQASLRTQMAALGIPVRQYKVVGVWLAEKLSRAKLNGRLLSRSPLSDLIEFEFLASAVRGKRSGFETLRIVAEADERLDKTELDRLIDQANAQHEWLTVARQEVAEQVFGGRAGAGDRTQDG